MQDLQIKITRGLDFTVNLKHNATVRLNKFLT